MTRFAPVYRALGMIVMLFGLTMLIPLIFSNVILMVHRLPMTKLLL